MNPIARISWATSTMQIEIVQCWWLGESVLRGSLQFCTLKVRILKVLTLCQGAKVKQRYLSNLLRWAFLCWLRFILNPWSLVVECSCLCLQHNCIFSSLGDWPLATSDELWLDSSQMLSYQKVLNLNLSEKVLGQLDIQSWVNIFFCYVGKSLKILCKFFFWNPHIWLDFHLKQLPAAQTAL